uniref:Uncharacterized protein n=1 Tax=Xenopus tropicalis TaxID=8364 RepID=A0A1B8Y2R0_XENTR
MPGKRSIRAPCGGPKRPAIHFSLPSSWNCRREGPRDRGPRGGPPAPSKSLPDTLRVSSSRFRSGWAGLGHQRRGPCLPLAPGTLAGHETAGASARPSPGSWNSGWAGDSQRCGPSFHGLLELWLGRGQPALRPVLPRAPGTLAGQGTPSAEAPAFPGLLELWLGRGQPALKPLPSPGSWNSGWAGDSQR